MLYSETSLKYLTRIRRCLLAVILSVFHLLSDPDCRPRGSLLSLSPTLPTALRWRWPTRHCPHQPRRSPISPDASPRPRTSSLSSASEVGFKFNIIRMPCLLKRLGLKNYVEFLFLLQYISSRGLGFESSSFFSVFPLRALVSIRPRVKASSILLPRCEIWPLETLNDIGVIEGNPNPITQQSKGFWDTNTNRSISQM